MTYKEKLLDPRWQKRRLEILNRDNFACQICAATEKTLHVHHLDYLEGKDPWDYPDNFLLTLCHECHESETVERPRDKKSILKHIRINFKSEYDRYLLWAVFSKYPNISVIFYLLEHLTDLPEEVEDILRTLLASSKETAT